MDNYKMTKLKILERWKSLGGKGSGNRGHSGGRGGPGNPGGSTSRFRTFDSSSDALTWQSRNESLNPPLSAEEIDALFEYKRSAYQVVNPDLREESWRRGPLSKYVIEHTDTAFEKANLSEPVMAYRGLGDDIDFLKNNDLTGYTIRDLGYSSVSLDKDIAGQFSDSITMEVRLPKGTRALNLERTGIETESPEMEMLLARGSKFKVIEDRRSGNNPIIVVEVIVDEE